MLRSWAHLVSDQTVAGRTLLAARHRAVVEVILLTHVAPSSDEAGPTLAATVLLTLTRHGALGVAIAGCRNKDEDVGPLITALIHTAQLVTLNAQRILKVTGLGFV